LAQACAPAHAFGSTSEVFAQAPIHENALRAQALARKHRREILDAHTRTHAQRTCYVFNPITRTPELRVWDEAAGAFVPSLDNDTFVCRLRKEGFCGTAAQAIAVRFQCHELVNGEFLVYAARALSVSGIPPAPEVLHAFCNELWAFSEDAHIQI
jgi:hypothetical protein